MRNACSLRENKTAQCSPKISDFSHNDVLAITLHNIIYLVLSVVIVNPQLDLLLVVGLMLAGLRLLTTLNKTFEMHSIHFVICALRIIKHVCNL